jgi:predicted HAD superfamily phosphohydrolase
MPLEVSLSYSCHWRSLYHIHATGGLFIMFNCNSLALKNAKIVLVISTPAPLSVESWNYT